MAAEYRNEGGIQNINSTVTGAQAVGTGAAASVGTSAEPNALSAAVETAVEMLLRQLPSLGLATDAADDAEAHLEDLRAEVVTAEPDRGRIRRALSGLTRLLGGVATAATSLAAVEKAVEPILRSLGA